MDTTAALNLLKAESSSLQELVTTLTAPQWRLPTPSAGWCIADQIGHLHWTDLTSLQALRNDPEFTKLQETFLATGDVSLIDTEAHRLGSLPPTELLSRWRHTRAELSQALVATPNDRKIPWFGPPLRAISMIAARTMETWAHGLDVYDALERHKPASPSLAVVCDIGMRTRKFAFMANGRKLPNNEIHLHLTLPNHDDLHFGPANAPDSITGSAFDFAAVVTQRRNIADTSLKVSGSGAVEWMQIAQAFAGLPTRGPQPGERLLPH